MTPIPTVRKVAPVCRVCQSDRDLILRDGPAVCKACIREAGVMGQATVRRSDTPPSLEWVRWQLRLAQRIADRYGNEPRDGMWR